MNITKTALLIMIVTIFSKILGFGRDVILSYFYGTTHISDIYLVSLTIPSVIFGFIGVGLSTAYIPMYYQIAKDINEEASKRYTNNIINIILVFTSIILVFAFIFAYPLVRVFALGFSRETLDLAVLFTRISLFGMLFSGLIYIFSSFLQIKNNYLVPALIGVPLNILTIVSILLSSDGNVLLLAIGTLIATASQVLLLIPYVRKKKFSYRFFLDLKDKYIKKMILIALPVILGSSVNQINILVDRTIASNIAIGGISALNYANKLNFFVQGIFVISITSIMYPLLSKMIAQGNIDNLKRVLSTTINSINILVIPATAGSMIFSEQVIKLLFGRGAFDQEAISMTAYALFFYSLGMIGFGLREILSRAFYSMQDSKTPMINAAIGMILNIILNIILSRYLGIGGIALATSISALFTTILLFHSLRKKIGPFGIKELLKVFLKIILASLIMGFISKTSFNYLAFIISENLSLLIAIGVGTVSYMLIIYYMNIKDVDIIVNVIKKKLGIS